MAAKMFSQLYTDGLTQVDELTGSGNAIAKTIIKAGINESYAEMAGIVDWKTLQNEVPVNGVQGTEEYTPVTSSNSVCRIRRIQSVLDQTNNKYIVEVQREQFEKGYPYVNPATDQGTPTNWYVSGYNSNRDMQIKLFRVPDQAITYNVIFYEEPLELVSDTDVPRIPDQFHYGLTYLGIAKYYEYYKDPMAGYYRSLHEQYKQKILAIEWGETDEMPQMYPQTTERGFVVGKIGRIYNG